MKIIKKYIINFFKLFFSNLCLEYVKIDSNFSVDRLDVHISRFEAQSETELSKINQMVSLLRQEKQAGISERQLHRVFSLAFS